MNFRRFVGVVGLMLLVGTLAAQDGPRKGVIKKVDADNNTLTITADGKDVVVKVTADTRVMDAGKQVDKPFKNKVFKSGAAVMFLVKDDTLVGIRIGEAKGKGDKRPGDGIQEGKIAAIDLDKLTITFKAGNTRVEAIANDDTNFFEVNGDDIKARLKTFKVGADVNYLIQQKDGKNVLVGIRALPASSKKDPGKKPPPFEKVDSSKLVPINELGNKEYKDGHKGGFYPDGKNVRPKDHEAAGLRLAKDVQPRDAAGKPAKNGKIVMLSIGMSNTDQASGGFARVLKGADGINPQLLFVNGAQGGMTAFKIQDPNEPKFGAPYWAEVDGRLRKVGVTRDQVQVIWIKQADAGPRSGWPTYAKTLEDELATIVQLFPKRFPNARLVYLSSRTYGGYANGPLNPEPYAYESAFSVKWLIERQLKGEAALNYDPGKGDVKAPWLSWGPYLWANGEKKNPDGLSYKRDDFSGDGTHHSEAGSEKIGRHMLQFFRNDSVARSWFLTK